MYLHLLTKEEKKNFLELAHHVANCDDRYVGQEKILIETYRQEMQLTEDEYKVQNLSFEQILENFTQTGIKSKIAMFLEISVLVISDYEFHDKEKNILKILKDKWQITEEKYESVLRWYRELQIIWKEDKS